MTTEICITVDTEFSIGGAFQDPLHRRPVGEANVDCPAEGRDSGLPFLLETFRAHGIAATFFVEALQTAYFGDAPMGRIVERIVAAGQDVQLHLHPCWRAFRAKDWRERLAGGPPDDRCDGRSADEMHDMIAEGLATLQRLGAPRPIALRTGNLRADRTIYVAMRAAGLRLASNIGLAYAPPREPALRLAGGRQWIEDVLEVPVLSYAQRLGEQRSLRLLTITGCAWKEIERLL